MSIASGDKTIKESGVTALRTTKESGVTASEPKINSLIQLLQESKKLTTFFTKLFARHELKYPNEEQSRYLNAVLDELMETLPGTTPENLDVAVFKVLLRYNFNHESVVKFYFAEIDQLILNHPRKEADILEQILKHCEALVRKDMAYNKAGHTLRKEVSHLITRRLKDTGNFEPFRLLLNANVFFPLLRLLKDENVFEEREFSQDRDSISYIFRDHNGIRFKRNTIINRLKIDNECNLNELKKLMDRMNKALDHHIKLRERPGRRNKFT